MYDLRHEALQVFNLQDSMLNQIDTNNKEVDQQLSAVLAAPLSTSSHSTVQHPTQCSTVERTVQHSRVLTHSSKSSIKACQHMMSYVQV